MPIATANEITQPAAAEGYSVVAFNIVNSVQMLGVIKGCESLNAPLIVQTSVTPSKFLTPEVLAAGFRAFATASDVPIALHLDHCEEVDFCLRCVDAGYTSVMFDGSRLPFEENVEKTCRVTEYARKYNVSVEGELGTITGVEDQISIDDDQMQLCNPDEAITFIERTKVNLFAPAIGTAHGVYKSSNPEIDCDLMKEIYRRITEKKLKTQLVVHGGTGLPDDIIAKLVQFGGAKFNVSTDIKLASINAGYEYLQQSKDKYNPGQMDKIIAEKISNRVRDWILKLGCANKGSV